MSALRPMVMDNGLQRAARSGDNTLASRQLLSISADANAILTVAAMAGGLIQFTGFTAGRTLTTDTAANIIAANPWMDIGDTFEVDISITTAFAGTYAAGAGVTLAGRATALASSISKILVTRTGAATVTVTGF